VKGNGSAARAGRRSKKDMATTPVGACC
jgi:hypothetical protein